MQEITNQLRELSYNLYWSWSNEFNSIFEEINRDMWKWSSKNPVKFLEAINQEYLFDVIEKKNLRYRIHNLYREYKKYMQDSDTYFGKKFFKPVSPRFSYFSAEYGITKCLKFYSGGLGTLSGDHMKSASDLGIPLIGIGLAYSFGYFRQLITDDNRQTELYEKSDFDKMPMKLVLDEDYRPVKITINLPGRKLYAQIWELSIGRVKLYLLDTLVDENIVEDKRVTDILYGGETDKRILQEILLGIGGMRLIETLGYDIKAFHINEGHSAFLVFERIKNTMNKHGMSFKDAKELCYYSNIFTTHTPVPAGIDIFPKWQMEKYFRAYAEEELHISFEELFAEGDLTRNQAHNDNFNMAYLAINNSNFVNGVSKLHGEIARKMWSLPKNRTQITSITNGIHTKTYLSPNSENLYRWTFGKDWYSDESIWKKISELPSEKLWDMRCANRKMLVKYVREVSIDKIKRLHGTDDEIRDVSNVLDENALTIGFARRFATYKRGTLILSHPERLKKILLDEKYKVQLIFSGKAHPKDEGGKNFISEILRFASENNLKHKIIFIENYDIDVAKHLVSGCDLWLNNPRRPLEASGTSGMKVVANGGLNFSILDGWWIEGYDGKTGWKISSPENENSLNETDVNRFESESLFDTLEKEIIPAFFERDEKGIPNKWIEIMRASIASLAPYFSTQRMVTEYNEMFYTKVR